MKPTKTEYPESPMVVGGVPADSFMEGPTGALRFVERTVMLPGAPGTSHKGKILQQQWAVTRIKGHCVADTKIEWRDVPLVEEEKAQ